jgi:hypothetical protein
MTKKVILKSVMSGFEKLYYNGKVYDARTENGEFFIGVRLTDCCESFSTISIDDGSLYCKKCYNDVESGEGDGEENLRSAASAPEVLILLEAYDEFSKANERFL